MANTSSVVVRDDDVPSDTKIISSNYIYKTNVKYDESLKLKAKGFPSWQ